MAGEQFWQTSLRDALRRQSEPGALPRVAVLGIGHELRGDDAAGVWLARALQPLVTGSERLLVIEAGPAPENVCGQLRRFRPDLIVMADAAHMRAEPATVRWLAWQDAVGIAASTHTLPIHILATYLTAELNCEVALLGFQPADLSLGTAPTPLVRQAIQATARALAMILLDSMAVPNSAGLSSIESSRVAEVAEPGLCDRYTH